MVRWAGRCRSRKCSVLLWPLCRLLRRRPPRLFWCGTARRCRTLHVHIGQVQLSGDGTAPWFRWWIDGGLATCSVRLHEAVGWAPCCKRRCGADVARFASRPISFSGAPCRWPAVRCDCCHESVDADMHRRQPSVWHGAQGRIFREGDLYRSYTTGCK